MRIIALIVALLGAAIATPVAMAQTRGPGFGHSMGVSFAGRSQSHSFGRSPIFLGDPFYADYPVAPLTIPPQYVMVQPTTHADAPPQTKSEPLMIELRGDRYVRFEGMQQSPREMNAPSYSPEVISSPALTPHPVRPELPPTVLIFRDGHREQVPEYAIVGGTIYASGDYWQSGYWTKNIEVSALNIPSTIQANHEAGVRFMLPSAPNEVVTRP
jgi:hypothetical protein